jgi:ElaB/YqjD/DUF883 family membrane-anchored ribosome-binding protein
METYFSNMTSREGTKEKLVEDLKILARDAEELVKAAGGQLNEKSRAEVSAALDRVKAGCRALQSRAREGARQADRLVREHPYQSIGLAFGIGLLIGVLVKRD